jgi:hypothetical protein
MLAEDSKGMLAEDSGGTFAEAQQGRSVLRDNRPVLQKGRQRQV